MSQVQPLRPPAQDGTESLVYVANPRAKRSFNTVLDASHLFDADGRSKVTTTIGREGSERRVEIRTEHALKGGAIIEVLSLTANDALIARTFERRLVDAAGDASREEKVAFDKGPLRFPDSTYPEVMLPFVLRWQPFESERRSFFAWIADRFVARVYTEVKGRSSLTVPGGKFDVVELMMYPDLNDWVALGNVVNTLAKPLLPKYRMWFEVAAPHRVVRFEGPYGPPGAPEIVLELAKT